MKDILQPATFEAMASDGPPRKKLKRRRSDENDEQDHAVSEDENISDNDDESSIVNNEFEIREVAKKIARRYGLEEFNFEGRLIANHLRNRRLLDIEASLRAMFQEMLDRAGRHYGPEDRVRLHIEHDGLEAPVVIHMQSKHNVTVDTIIDRLVYKLNNSI